MYCNDCNACASAAFFQVCGVSWIVCVFERGIAAVGGMTGSVKEVKIF